MKPIIYLVVAAALILGLYYVMSPYQNCMRAETSKIYAKSLDPERVCQNLTSW